jgi:hypothetical protein
LFLILVSCCLLRLVASFFQDAVKDTVVDCVISAEGVLVGNVEETIDAEITRIAVEARSETEGLRDGDSHGTDEN